MQEKMVSILELAKYKVGQVKYWVAFRPVSLAGIQVPEGEEWMAQAHPKVLYDRGLASEAWYFKQPLPRLCAWDFQYVVDILTSEPIAERFEITNIHRCTDTGEFFYANNRDEWMPESYLFNTPQEAMKEKARIKKMFADWAAKSALDDL